MKLKIFLLLFFTTLLCIDNAYAVRARIKPAQRRGRIIHTNNIKGRGIAVLLGGYRGKYLKHYALPFTKYRMAPAKTVNMMQQNTGKREPASLQVDSVEKTDEEQTNPPPLHVNFVGYSDIIINKQELEPQLKDIALYLARSEGAIAVLSGNTGLDYDDGRPIGKGENVMVYPAALNGKICTTRELMLARANAIKSILINEYKIAPQRIEISAGEQKIGSEFRTVGVEYKGQKTVKHDLKNNAPVHAARK